MTELPILERTLERLEVCRTCPAIQAGHCTDADQACLELAEHDQCPRASFTLASPPTVSIIITVGPGMRKWLPDALRSCEGQGAEVVIVYDKERPGPEAAERIIMRGDWGNVQLARRAGMTAATGSMILFLDADNALPQGFVRSAARQLQRASLENARVAGIYPDIRYHDASWRPLGKRLDPPKWDRGRFDRENFVDASTICWRHALETSWRETVTHERLEDWHMWGQLVADGWTFQRGKGLTLLYRVLPQSMTQTEHAVSYVTRYSVDTQPLTVFVPVARLWAWKKLRKWLQQLPERCRLVLCEGAGDDQLWARLQHDRPHFDHLHDLRLYRHSRSTLDVPAVAGLADADRHQTEAEVHRVVSGIYNRAAQEASTPLMLILEDDILPAHHPAELIAKLSEGLDEQTIAVSGVYHSRYDRNIVAWSRGAGRSLEFVTDADLNRFDFVPVSGTGFGCLLVRREALRAFPLSITPEEPWFDPRFFRQASRRLGGVKLCSSVTCQHRSRPES